MFFIKDSGWSTFMSVNRNGLSPSLKSSSDLQFLGQTHVPDCCSGVCVVDADAQI